MSEDVLAIFEICEARNWRIAVAESCTGGGLGAKITSVSGASQYFWGGVIAYANEVKTGVLKVNKDTLSHNGAVSEEVAREMALGACSVLGVEIGLSITGVAGPGAEGPKPEGRVCFGVAWPNGLTSTTQEFGAIGRENVRNEAASFILKYAAGLMQ